MKIAIDGLHLFGPYGGVQHSLARLVKALRGKYPDDELTLYVPRDFAGPPAAGADDPGLRLRRCWFPGRWRVVRTFWRNFRLQSLAYKANCDVLHGPTYALPAALTMPGVLTIHDVIALTHPGFATPGSARVQKSLLPRSVKAARRIIVPSQAVKAEAERVLKADPDRIDVIPWGVSEEFRPIQDRNVLRQAQESWKLPERFVLFVGTLEPKKNIEGLVKSFFAAKMHRKMPHELVLAGRLGWKMNRLKRLILELNAQQYVHFTGYVPQDALPYLYNLAELCVLPSHVEGFGMPVLEAMACGCPVAISGAPALAEVAGGAAFRCEPVRDKPYQALREAFEELLLGRQKTRGELRARGFARAREFTWERTAQLTRAAYAKALG